MTIELRLTSSQGMSLNQLRTSLQGFLSIGPGVVAVISNTVGQIFFQQIFFSKFMNPTGS